MAYTERLNEQLAIVATIDPDAYTVGATTTTTEVSDVIDMDVYHRVMFILMTGTLPAQTAINFNVLQGTATATVTTALAAITALGAGDDDEQVVVEIEGQDVADGFRYIVGQAVLENTGAGTITLDVAMIAVGDTARYKPASDGDLASVSEIVNA